MNVKQAIESIANGNYGLWSVTAKLALDNNQLDTFQKEFEEQLDDPKSNGNMKKTFPPEIIEALDK